MRELGIPLYRLPEQEPDWQSYFADPNNKLYAPEDVVPGKQVVCPQWGVLTVIRNGSLYGQDSTGGMHCLALGTGDRNYWLNIFKVR